MKFQLARQEGRKRNEGMKYFGGNNELMERKRRTEGEILTEKKTKQRERNENK